jgi:hypothetical protein
VRQKEDITSDKLTKELVQVEKKITEIGKTQA